MTYVKSVDEGAKEDVDDANEALGSQHSLPEVPRVAHLSKEGNKQQGTTVRVHHRVHTGHGGSSAVCRLLVQVWGRAGKGLDGHDGLEQSGVEDELVVDAIVGGGYHDDDKADDVQPDGSVAKPTKTLQATDGTQSATNDHGDEHTNDVADVGVELSNDLGVADNNDSVCLHGRSAIRYSRQFAFDSVLFLFLFLSFGNERRQPGYATFLALLFLKPKEGVSEKRVRNTYATVMNCWRAWKQLIKWRQKGP